MVSFGATHTYMMRGVLMGLFYLWLVGLLVSAPLVNGHSCSARASRHAAQPLDGAEAHDAEFRIPCGKTTHLRSRTPTRRIDGGYLGRAGELPFLASFENRQCAATIIDEHHLLTSAECTKDVDKNNFTVYVGCHRRKDCEAKRISNYIAHQNYDKLNELTRDAYNIALLKTDTPMYFRLTPSGLDSVNRICLPNENDGYEPGDPVTIAGWGEAVDYDGKERQFAPEMATDMEILTSKLCAENLELPGWSVYFSDKQLCVVDPQNNEMYMKRSCGKGDMGGPLLGLKSGSYELLGLRLRRIGCRTWIENLNLYIRVSAFLDWIEWAKKEMA